MARFRIFKTKAFARWMRMEGLADPSLGAAVFEMASGDYGANLGGGLFKKRVALSHRGKRGNVRTLIAYQVGSVAIFLLGYTNNERNDINPAELASLKLMAKTLLDKGGRKIETDVAAGMLIEVKRNG